MKKIAISTNRLRSMVTPTKQVYGVEHKYSIPAKVNKEIVNES